MIIDARHEYGKYREACFGGRVLPPVQSVEIRRAFFSGMLACMGLLTELATEPQPEAAEMLGVFRNQIIAELALFIREQA